MRVEGIWISGVGVAIPRTAPIVAAIERGEYPAEEAAKTEQLSLAVAPTEKPAAELAVDAGRAAIEEAGEIGPIGLLVHAVVRDSGCDGWSAASYVQRRLGIADCLAIELRAGCNSLVGWELACGRMQGPGAYESALVTASDTWPAPFVDRYVSAAGHVFGDGGGAVLLSRAPGVARVLSVCTASDPEMEAITRGSHPLHGPHPETFDLRQRAREFLAEVMSYEELWRRRHAGTSRAVGQALEEAGVGLADIARVAPIHQGRELLMKELEPLGVELSRTTWEHGRTLGHLGASDQAAGLRYLLDSGALGAGDLVLVMGIGMGHQWGAAVVEVEARRGREEGAGA